MTVDEYIEWVKKTYLMANDYKNNKAIDIVFDNGKTKVMVIDLITMKTVTERIPDVNGIEREAVAIAFTKLRGKEIPNIVLRKDEPEFRRAEKGAAYYAIDSNYNGVVTEYIENGDQFDDVHAETGNYFLTQERAEEVLKKIKMLFLLEKMHAIYCPDYKPDWKDGNRKYYIRFNHDSKKFGVWHLFTEETAVDVYFPSREIVYKVIDALNEELGQGEKSNEV